MAGTMVWKSNRSGISGFAGSAGSGADAGGSDGMAGAGMADGAGTGAGTSVSSMTVKPTGRTVLILSRRSPAMMTIKWVAYRSATGGMLMMTGGTHAGRWNPVLSIACKALPAMEKLLNSTSPTHG